MITEVVTWKLPKSITREQVAGAFRKSVPHWQQATGLVRKNYIYDSAAGVARGVYLWKHLEDAKRGHDDALRKRIKDTFGDEPVFAYFETPIAIDNTTGAVMDEGVGI